MSIIKTTTKKIPFYKRKGWKIAFLILGFIIIIGIAFGAYVYSTGSKVFENGITGKNLLETIYGKNQLKGEADDRINILIMGMGGKNHPGGMLADSIMVLSIQPKEKKAAMISIPRDLLVPIPGYKEDKINSSFADGYNAYVNKTCPKKPDSCRSAGIAAGANLTSNVVSNILGISIHYYVTADFDGFEKIIDSLGGVDIYVDKAIYDPSFPDSSMKGYSPFKITAGQHHMDGATALKYARSRETTSDFDRARRQQQVIAAVKEKASQIGFVTNPQKLIDVISTLGDSIKTNFSIAEIKSFATIIKDVPTSEAITKVLSTATGGFLIDYNNGTYYEKPKAGNFSEIQNYVNNIFNTTNPTEPAKIEILNGSKTANAAVKLSDVLTLRKYNVVSYKSTTATSKTVIYDYSGGKQKATLDYLKAGLGVSVVQKTVTSGNKVDIAIILGNDYTGFSKKLND